MTTQSTPRFTLPDPDRAPMTPLPAELLARILKFAQAGQSIPDQHKTRLNFEKVCKAWFMCDFRWRVVAIHGLQNADKFAATLASMASLVRLKRGGTRGAKAAAGLGVVEDAASRVKTVYLEVPVVKGKEKRASLGKLVGSMSNVSTASVAIACAWATNDENGPGAAVVAALSKLEKLKDFTIGGAGPSYVGVANGMLLQLVPKWPQLESFTLTNCSRGRNDPIPTLFQHSTSLARIELNHSAEWTDEPRLLLSDLPLTTRTLIVNSPHFYQLLGDHSKLNSDEHLLRVASNLRSVTLVDGKFSPSALIYVGGARGQLDGLIEHLNNVEHLVISPFAVSDLAALAVLKKLTSLEVLIGQRAPLQPVQPRELLDLISDSTSLQKLAVTEAIANDWDDGKKALVEGAAQPSVDLTWV